MPRFRAPQQSRGRLQASFEKTAKRSTEQKNGRKCDLATALLPKGDTRATNAKAGYHGWGEDARGLWGGVLECKRGEVVRDWWENTVSRPRRQKTSPGRLTLTGDARSGVEESRACSESVTPSLPESVDLGVSRSLPWRDDATAAHCCGYPALGGRSCGLRGRGEKTRAGTRSGAGARGRSAAGPGGTGAFAGTEP